MNKKMYTSRLSALLGAVVAQGSVCLADNPIIQTRYTADPAPLVHDGVVYLYTTHDDDEARGFVMYDWMLYSSTDMVNWTDHGTVAGVRDPKTFEWADGRNAWAPQVIEKDGTFYLYGPTVRNGHMVIGVAVADNPMGPFKDAIGKPLIFNPESNDDIDPSVFIDDDGQAYLYWGHQRIFYVTLNDDMISYSGEIVEFERPELFEEGPWFYKRNGNYYLAFASYCCPEGMGYAMSDSPTGPWKTMGYIMKPRAASSGNHPGIIDYKGKSYVFGFNYNLNFSDDLKHRERRSICVEEFEYAEDGSIVELPWWTREGVLQIELLNPYKQTEAETICWSVGLKTEKCSEGGMNVCNIDNTDYIKVKGVDFGSGAKSFSARVAAATAGGKIELRLDNPKGTLVGTCEVPATGGEQKWETVSCTVSGAEGTHDLYLRFVGGSDELFRFNWWKFGK